MEDITYLLLGLFNASMNIANNNLAINHGVEIDKINSKLDQIIKILAKEAKPEVKDDAI